MKRKQYERSFLLFTTVVALALLPFAIMKRPLKDWIIVYLVSCIGNSYADRYLVSKGYIKYKIKPLSKKTPIHLPFDYVHYPLFLLYYNQWTLNSRPIGIILKLFVFIIPQVIIETIAEKKTDLITWKKGWKWHHSFFSMAAKFLLCRMIIGLIRILNRRELSLK
ncbi:CBO0543 family protein [Halalkalibacter urbisdiaboli]|uniref:CBO0543 family protein n=1 Tax=Halalkalibacter urbisdiaboli TaxID=1960589 RepID=UPI000B437851|nr:CBO0543 family protein [Halalkalibacter urbisdiaboli]